MGKGGEKDGGGAAATGGVSSLGVVFIVFLILKLTKVPPVANWPWWIITSPIWGLLALMCCCTITAGTCGGCAMVCEKVCEGKNKTANGGAPTEAVEDEEEDEEDNA